MDSLACNKVVMDEYMKSKRACEFFLPSLEVRKADQALIVSVIFFLTKTNRVNFFGEIIG